MPVSDGGLGLRIREYLMVTVVAAAVTLSSPSRSITCDTNRRGGLAAQSGRARQTHSRLGGWRCRWGVGGLLVAFQLPALRLAFSQASVFNLPRLWGWVAALLTRRWLDDRVEPMR